MNTVEKIRADLRHLLIVADEEGIDPSVKRDEVEALCDLADAAETLRHPLTAEEEREAIKKVRLARARLDGEDGRWAGPSRSTAN